jgi:hypothetical protein
MKMLWGSLSRLCAGGLDGLRMRLVIGSTAVSPEPRSCDQSLILWSGESGDCADEFYQLSMHDTDDILAVAGLINEALESRDAFGRLYLLSNETDDFTILGYFTDGEAERLEEHDIDAEWI